MWDDLAPGIVGAGPTHTVLDPSNPHNNILDVAQGGKIKLDWSFSGPALGLLDFVEFHVQMWADPVGLGNNTLVGNIAVAGTVTAVPPAAQAYETEFTISLPVGAYRITTLITSTAGPFTLPVSGFVDGPVLQVRPAP
jgi:hypothetical protein